MFNYGCRCDECVQADNDYKATLRASGDPPSHGLSGYNNYGCRCSICSDAMRRYQREYRARIAAGVA